MYILVLIKPYSLHVHSGYYHSLHIYSGCFQASYMYILVLIQRYACSFWLLSSLIHAHSSSYQALYNTLCFLSSLIHVHSASCQALYMYILVLFKSYTRIFWILHLVKPDICTSWFLLILIYVHCGFYQTLIHIHSVSCKALYTYILVLFNTYARTFWFYQALYIYNLLHFKPYTHTSWFLSIHPYTHTSGFTKPYTRTFWFLLSLMHVHSGFIKH